MSVVDQAEFHFFHFFPYTNLPGDHADVRVAVGRLPQLQLRPADRPRPVHPLPVGDGPRRPARLRRPRAQRAPQHAVLDEPGAEPHGGGADPPDEGQDQRVRHAAEPRLPEPPRRGVRHARRDVRRAAAHRLPARHRAWSTGPTPSTRRRPGPASASRSTSSCAAGPRTARRATPATSTPTATSTRGPSRCRSRTPSATSSAPARPRRSSSPPSSASGTRSCSSRRRRSCKVFEHFRERLAHHGHEPTPDKVTVGVMAYVAETDAKAEEEFMPHVMYFFENALRTTPRYLNPPGYVTVPEFRKRIQAADVHGTSNWDDLVDDQPHRRRHAGEGRRRRRQLARGGRQQPRQPQPHARRHAQLEGRQEHDAVRRRSHPAARAPAQPGA